MTRSDSDSWDLASSVGATATMVAAARALASREPDALISDPYAEGLVRAVGIDFFTKLVDGTLDVGDADDSGVARLMTTIMAVRTRFFDDFFLNASRDGVQQSVILASGLDSRAYRLPWPDGATVFELDQPQVIEAKTAAMTHLGAHPTCDRRIVAVDLRDDWPAALRSAGFDPALPTAWSTEGLLVYLPPEAQDRLFDDITAMSAPGSALATEYHPDGGASMSERAAAVSDAWGDHGFRVNLPDLFYAGERRAVADYLTEHGWRVTTAPRSEMFARYNRDFPENDLLAPMRESLAVTATLS
ncbi:class I SAM-dependent methyltransferase [Mycolicibacterium arenosum]|uniref:S-adenosyl-L-methionine-dependent methyltransferase n=1 Tax=Mycolicibacterium arenosum TaxID=2952157 RepID=A0ABT1M965_9MYCO|nr:class I SAM-dependent methyltransferase [Mycolicibacterium sp. CAU 1645]MCP9275420.1 class I SAM-dependent methyltransferase [Mycolicibacterium sp. CAU 1645]